MTNGIETWSNELDVQDLVSRFGSPLYVMNHDRIVKNVNDYATFFNVSDIKFPIKTNPAANVIASIASLGCGVDCASLIEIEMAAAAGISHELITYFSPVLDRKLAKKLYLNGSTVVIDSEEDLEWACQELHGNGRLLIRVLPFETPQYSNPQDWNDMVAHASKGGRFGIDERRIIGICSKLERKIVDGLHFHLGTQLDNIEQWIVAIKRANKMIDDLRSWNHPASIIDIGGGLGISFNVDDRLPSIIDLCNAIRDVADSRIKYQVEPGQSLIGDAVCLLSKVMKIKNVDDKHYAYLDVGTDQLTKVTLLRWSHPMMASKKLLPMSGGHDSICGPLCFSGDVLLPSTTIGSINVNDVITIKHCGAYCHALENSFNGRSTVNHVMLRDNVVSLCIPRISTWNSSRRTNISIEDVKCDALTSFDTSKLFSEYLMNGINNDTYTIMNAILLKERSYEFKIKCKSDVNFASVPLLIRVCGNACIVSLLHSLGITEKARTSVFATDTNLRQRTMFNPNEPFNVRVDLDRSSFINERATTARFSVNGKVTTGSFRLVHDANMT